MERKIGEIFEHNGEWYQCADWAVNPCSKCDFDGEGICCDELPCTSSQRKDKKYVFFKKLEKVGEPFSCNYYGDKRLIMMQEYRAYDNRIILPNGIPMYVTDEKHKRVAIAIKQNQEDMEEKKDAMLPNWESTGKNLKPFDLEAARSGKPVCTRDGRKARIICFDLQDPEYDMVALILGKNGFESICTFNSNGRFNDADDVDKQSKHDLMMLPEKKEGWVNIVKDTDGSYCCKGEVHSDYNDAILENINVLDKRGITVKIEWYE